MLTILAQTSDGGSYLGFGQGAPGTVITPAAVTFVGIFVALIAILLAIKAVRKKKRPRGRRRNGNAVSKKRQRQQQKDINDYIVSAVDMDPLINPPTGRPRPIPDELPVGTLLVSQRLGVKCLLINQLNEVGRRTLKEICARKLKQGQAVYLPMGTQIYKDEILHQGRDFVVKLRKGSLFTSVGGHPNSYLLDALSLPLRRELSSNPQVLSVTESTAQKYLQNLIDIPASFDLVKEDVLFDASTENQRKVEKGALVISGSGALVGVMLENYQLPHTGPLSELEALFQLRTHFARFPLETLIQRSAKEGSRPIPIDRGTFIFSSAGKVYFVWKEGLEVDEATLIQWSKYPSINHQRLLEVSTTVANRIGGPGVVVTLDELNYLRDVFRQAGTTNLLKEGLLLDRSVLYKFMVDLPYAQTGKFRHLLGTKVHQLNSASKDTLSIELGGKDIEITDADLHAVREHLLPEGRMLIKIGTQMRIRDERMGDWIYIAHTNLFYPYETFSRPYMEEFIPESVRFKGREPKKSVIIGPQDNPREGDVGGAGEPIGDLLAIINNALGNKEEPRPVFVLDGTLFHWKNKIYRVNEELVFRPHEIAEKLGKADLEGLSEDWKINPVVEDDEEEEEIPDIMEPEEDLEDLPFDTGALR
jgi:hypothetical protein